MKIYTKETLIEALINIRDLGFVQNARHGNHGGIGNTLEELLGIEENNLPMPNAAEWELKTQRLNTKSLTTLFHLEPSPQALKFVPSILLLKYGWRHQQAGLKYPETEMSFRQTINGVTPSDRGFKIVISESEKKILVNFNYQLVSIKHLAWLKSVENRIGLGELNPQPYWGFADLAAKAGTKLHNCFYVQAKVKKENGIEFYHYQKIFKLSRFSFDGFLKGLDEGFVLVDFDARTGHNHGTKFRLRQNRLVDLYENSEEI
ncbi:MvaI/BcnI family restriction endonuclease [Merismopedia glauca]|uniref:NciI n=1 Tax=Merismopedia glauca CCAP 1448/3 TaxID=1296344 RepID=A0A2T1C7T8_9CYAN|nr:MvaI/BcnI family restriction endonuclease [Merismopedia glauca]PSB04321.1 nciI [Merismopedia glauca CCAP 1448/3]